VPALGCEPAALEPVARGDYNIAEVAALFSVRWPTVYRSLERTTALPPLPVGTRPAPDIARDDQLLTRRPD
jgi:hypothetical protein